jgi:hypothetical protein
MPRTERNGATTSNAISHRVDANVFLDIPKLFIAFERVIERGQASPRLKISAQGFLFLLPSLVDSGLFFCHMCDR